MSQAKPQTRRAILAGGGALLLSGCGAGVRSSEADRIDRQIDEARGFLFARHTGTRDLEDKAAGVLYMPTVTKAGFGVGGSYGKGGLRINNVSVDYYQAFQGTFGFQIGAAQYAHAIFFMTPEALRRFRSSDGVTLGADLEYATIDRGGNLSAKTMAALDPVIAIVFGQTGLIAAATVEGTIYRRMTP